MKTQKEKFTLTLLLRNEKLVSANKAFISLISGKSKENIDTPVGLLGTQTGDNMDDLMALCSGNFTATQGDSSKSKVPLTGSSTGFDVADGAGEGMSQLLGIFRSPMRALCYQVLATHHILTTSQIQCMSNGMKQI